MIWHALRTAFVSIWTKKTRSFLTMLGIIIGVAQIIALIGLGQGVKQDVSKEVTQLGTNTLVVLPGKVQTDQGGFNPAASVGASTLTENDVAALRKLPEVVSVATISLIGGLPTVGEKSDPAALTIAVEPAYFDIVNTVKIASGRSFTADDNAQKLRVMVLGEQPRQVFFPGRMTADVLKQKVKLGKEEYDIVGLTEAAQSTSLFGSNTFSNAVFIPYATAKANIANTQIFRLAVKVKEDTDAKAAAEELSATLRDLHGADDFTVFTQDDLLKVVDDILGVITKAIVGLSAISLIVGGIGIMNIMLVAVTERTREIGVRKAVGASNWHILLQFLVEAIIISILGGAIGVAITAVAGFIVKQKAGLTIVIDFQSVLIATAFSVGVGVIFGLAPAIRAARKDPIEALRYE